MAERLLDPGFRIRQHRVRRDFRSGSGRGRQRDKEASFAVDFPPAVEIIRHAALLFHQDGGGFRDVDGGAAAPADHALRAELTPEFDRPFDVGQRRLRLDIRDQAHFAVFERRKQFRFDPPFRVTSGDDQHVAGRQQSGQGAAFAAAEQDFSGKMEFAVHSFTSCSVR
ncbi:hypothetical protein SDC9_178373 [bioreactor metagenome]|uniref:Uncharacterized protein n=1 Tax=bioreactor metagenome TaxID=1076179 RepID=A0A645GXX4_9ZZZZ